MNERFGLEVFISSFITKFERIKHDNVNNIYNGKERGVSKIDLLC